MMMYGNSEISLIFLSFSVLFDNLLIRADEPLGNMNMPSITINNCCAGQMESSECEVEFKSFRNNVTATLDEQNQRIENVLRSLITKSNIRDCQDIQLLGHVSSGIYTISPEGTFGFPVRCDMDTAGGGWTVFQRRVSNSDFYKTWTDYQTGFGNLSENFWLGNQQLHMITVQGWYQLRVDLTSMDNENVYAEYNVFSVGNVESGYKLTVDGYSGNAGDSLDHHNGRKFSASDRDNDNYSGHCAKTYTGPWWHRSCHLSNLNGVYGAKGGKGPVWKTFKGYNAPLKRTEMKIRRWQP